MKKNFRKINKKGYTLVEIIVSITLVMLVMIYLLRTIVVISNKNNDLIVLEDFSIYEENLLNAIYKNVDDAFKLNKFGAVTCGDNSTNLDNCSNSIKIKNKDNNGDLQEGKLLEFVRNEDNTGKIIYDGVIYELPENVKFRPKNNKVFSVSKSIHQGLHDYYIITIYLKLNDKDKDMKILYQNKEENKFTVTFNPNYNTSKSSGGKWINMDKNDNLKFTNNSATASATFYVKLRYGARMTYTPRKGEDIEYYDSTGSTTSEEAKKMKLVGWNTRADGSGTDIKNGIKGDTTYYAQWTNEPVTYIRIFVDKRDVRFNAYETFTPNASKGLTLEDKNGNGKYDNEDHIILHNGSKATATIIGEDKTIGKDGLPNYNNTSYINISFPGQTVNKIDTSTAVWANGSAGNNNKLAVWAKVDNNGEFITQNNKIVVYDQDTEYKATDFCDAKNSSNKECTVNLRVYWQPELCTVTANANGGVLSNLSGWTKRDTLNKISEKKVHWNETLTLPTATYTGYKFVNWYNTAAVSGGTVKPASLSNKSYCTTYYARWDYDVKFNCNGGTGTMTDQNFHKGVAQNLKSNACTRQYYSFVNWKDSYGTGETYSNGQSYNYGPKTLYAQWNRNKYTVKYTCSGATGDLSTQTFNEGQAQNLHGAVSKTGYIFGGWKSSKDSKTYAASASYNGGATTMTCVMTPIKYKVYYVGVGATGETYDNNSKCSNGYCGLARYASGSKVVRRADENGGGWTFWDAKEYVYDKEYTLIANHFSRTCWKFYGWALYHLGQVEYGNQAKVKNLTSTNGDIVYLWIRWEKDKSNCPSSTSVTVQEVEETVTESQADTYRVTLNVNGGKKWTQATCEVGNGWTFSGNSCTRRMKYNEKFTKIPSPTPQSGYSFKEWKSGGTVITGSSKKTTKKDSELTASYTANTYKLTYDVNGGSNWKSSCSNNDTSCSPCTSPSTYASNTATGCWKNVTYKNTLGTLPTPRRYCYKFNGWTASGTSVTANNTKNSASDSTLKAQWSRLGPYKITFDSNGGAVNPTQTTRYCGEEFNVNSLPTPWWNDEHEFEGWYTDKTFSKRVTTHNITKDETYYARWKTCGYNSTKCGTTSSGWYSYATSLPQNCSSQTNLCNCGYCSSESHSTNQVCCSYYHSSSTTNHCCWLD